jgi:hypothetical protein
MLYPAAVGEQQCSARMAAAVVARLLLPRPLPLVLLAHAPIRAGGW